MERLVILWVKNSAARRRHQFRRLASCSTVYRRLQALKSMFASFRKRSPSFSASWHSSKRFTDRWYCLFKVQQHHRESTSSILQKSNAQCMVHLNRPVCSWIGIHRTQTTAMKTRRMVRIFSSLLRHQRLHLPSNLHWILEVAVHSTHIISSMYSIPIV
jgi:hypothetical protein